MVATWITGTGSQAMSEVLSTFKDDGVTYVVVRCGRGRYDAQEPFTVLKESDCIITAE
jgi:hypothetical protein